MDAIQAMCTRRSIRKYTADPVKEEDLRKILDCGRLAPTGVNRQAWRFIVVTDAAVKAAVAEATDYGKFIASAPVVIAVAIGPDAACPNEDSAAAACNMLNAAHALGYGGCWIGSNGNATAERVGKVLRLPAVLRRRAGRGGASREEAPGGGRLLQRILGGGTAWRRI